VPPLFISFNAISKHLNLDIQNSIKLESYLFTELEITHRTTEKDLQDTWWKFSRTRQCQKRTTKNSGNRV
jgi:hypothetical protein